jgi:hypothetical protein
LKSKPISHQITGSKTDKQQNKDTPQCTLPKGLFTEKISKFTCQHHAILPPLPPIPAAFGSPDWTKATQHHLDIIRKIAPV